MVTYTTVYEKMRPNTPRDTHPHCDAPKQSWVHTCFLRGGNKNQPCRNNIDNTHYLRLLHILSLKNRDHFVNDVCTCMDAQKITSTRDTVIGRAYAANVWDDIVEHTIILCVLTDAVKLGVYFKLQFKALVLKSNYFFEILHCLCSDGPVLVPS
eukprot:PhF_6_TR6884/c1_g3_i1/m.9924